MLNWFQRTPVARTYNPLSSSGSAVHLCAETIIPDRFIDAYNAAFEFDISKDSATVNLESGPIQSTSLQFKTGEPSCFYEEEGGFVYRGQDRTKRRISSRLNTLLPTERFKCLLVGSAGTGKTTLARIIASRLNGRRIDLGLEPGLYYEVLPAQLEDRAVLDQFMLALSGQPFATLFIDEVHKLPELERWFHVLHDSGVPRWPLADGRMINIPETISFLAATTDPGLLDNTTGGAMRRRLEPEFRLDEPELETLIQIAQDVARGQNLDISVAAATVIAERSYFPWFVKMIFSEVQLLAREQAKYAVGWDMATEALDLLEIDARGLRREDREVIRCLLRVPRRLVTKDIVRYSMSEEALCAAAGIDRATYKKRVQPKLLRTGLLMTLGGQCLTDKAVAEYGWLNP